MKQELEVEVKNLGLFIDFSNIPGDNVRINIMEAITQYTDTQQFIHGIGSISEYHDNYGYITRSKELYRVTEFENKSMYVYSESMDYFVCLCRILDSMAVNYKITNICFSISYNQKLEDVASIYTRESPYTPLNESMFMYKNINANYGNSVKFYCNLQLNEVENGIIHKESIINSIKSCNAVYNGEVIQINNITKVDYIAGDLHILERELDFALQSLELEYRT